MIKHAGFPGAMGSPTGVGTQTPDRDSHQQVCYSKRGFDDSHQTPEDDVIFSIHHEDPD